MTDASSDDLPINGPALARELQQRHPGKDWLAALAKAAQEPRGDVERHLQEQGPLPSNLVDASSQVAGLLDPEEVEHGDDRFAKTNDVDAPIEVDAEAGTVVQPSNKGMPSQSGSDHEMGTKPPGGEKNGEFLSFIGVPEFLSPLHKK